MGGLRTQAFGIAVAALVLAGCADRQAEDRARLAQIEADGDALNQAADALEARLLTDRARVALWSELKERHQHVSAIATQNADEHLNAMVRYFAKQERRGKKLSHRRVASADPFAFGQGKGSRKRTHLRHDR